MIAETFLSQVPIHCGPGGDFVSEIFFQISKMASKIFNAKLFNSSSS